MVERAQGADRADGELLAIAVDGKAVRGAVGVDGTQVHLMAAATHGDQLVLGQVEVGAKTNEIPMFAPLIGACQMACVARSFCGKDDTDGYDG